MRLLLINQYYPPDHAPTGQMLRGVVDVLVSQGHDVTVLCSGGGYSSSGGARPPSLDKLGRRETVVRIASTRFGRSSFLGKIADYLSFYIGVSAVILFRRPRPDRIIVLTTPPYLSLLARALGKWVGADHMHWVMDLYPDVMVSHGLIPEEGVVHRILSRLACFGYGGVRCGGVMTLGPDMARKVEKYLPASREASWVPLWSTDSTGGFEVRSSRLAGSSDPAGRLRVDRGWAKDELVLMYSGNMGVGHRFSEILELLQKHGSAGSESFVPLLGRRRLRVVFYGGGKRRSEIEAFVRDHPEAPVELHDYVPSELLAAHLGSADVHLASLAPGWEGTMLPSKLQGIFEAGRPVIFVGSATSSMACWIRESSGGWVVPPGDVEALLQALLESADERICSERGESAFRFARQNFDRHRNSERVTKWMVGRSEFGVE